MRHLRLFEDFIYEEKKKMADMSADEKIAVYRSKMTKERKNPAPDQAKIENLSKKVEDLQKKSKKKKKPAKP